MKTYSSHYINGQWVPARSADHFTVYDSSTEEVMATVPAGTAAEAGEAVLAARAAFEGWAGLPVLPLLEDDDIAAPPLVPTPTGVEVGASPPSV